MSAKGLASDDLRNPMCIFWYKSYKIGYVVVGRRLQIKYCWVRDEGGMAGLSVFLTALSPLGRIGTVVAHVLLSPMKLVGAAVSKTASAGSTLALGDA